MNKNRDNRHMRHLSRLAKMAEDVSPVGAARLAAGIVLKNKEVSFGICSYKTDPFQSKYSTNEDCIHIHAEIAAIKNALRRISVEDLKRSTLYIARVKREKANDKNFIWGLARPCNGCQKAIAAFEIGKVVYTCDGVDGFSEY